MDRVLLELERRPWLVVLLNVACIVVILKADG